MKAPSQVAARVRPLFYLVSFFLIGSLTAAAPALPAAQKEEPKGGEKEGEKKEGEKKDEEKKEGETKDEEKKEGEKKEGKEDAGSPGLNAWGNVKRLQKTDFYTFVPRSAKKSAAAFVKITNEAVYLRDRIIRLTDLKEGQSLWIFGRPVERETATSDGGTGIDRQLQNVSAVASGQDLKVNREYKDPRLPDSKWLEATVSKPGPAIWVKVEGNEYKVVMRQNTAVFVREESEKGPLKNGALVQLAAEESTERPPNQKGADAKKASFLATKVVLLDRRLEKDVYPILLR